jgi:hypothetical protein
MAASASAASGSSSPLSSVAVPEPASGGLFLLGLFGAWLAARRFGKRL